jgi:type I restriction enzyme S subunit
MSFGRNSIQRAPRVALADLGKWTGGGTPRKGRPEYWSGSIPWVSPKDMKVSRLRDAADHISEAGVRESATNVVPAGSILMVTRSGILSHTFPVAIADVPVALNQDLKALTPKPNVDPTYLYWALKNMEHSILDDCSKDGTTVASIDTARLRRIEIPLPPLDEQQQIVASVEGLLSRSDVATASLSRIRHVIAVARASLFAAAVSGRLLQSRVNPDQWREARVNELLARLQYGTSSKASTNSAGVPVLRMGNIRNGRIDYTDLKYLPVDHPDLADTLLEPGDVLFNRTNSPELVGKCAVFTGYPNRISFASYLVRLSPLPQVNPSWLAAAINGPLGREYIAAVRVQQVGQANVSAKKIGAMPLRVPPREVQDALVAEMEKQIDGLDLVLRSVDTNLVRASRLKRSILLSVFTGELVREWATDQTDRVPQTDLVSAPGGVAW